MVLPPLPFSLSFTSQHLNILIFHMLKKSLPSVSVQLLPPLSALLLKALVRMSHPHPKREVPIGSLHLSSPASCHIPQAFSPPMLY